MFAARMVMYFTRESLAFAGLAALLTTLGCALGEPDTVTRSPDLGQAISTPLGQDASSISTISYDAAGREASRLDAGTPAGDARDAEIARPDVIDAAAASDSAAQPRDGSAETAYAGEVGDDCGARGFVFCNDFEDGAVGLIATGGAWEVATETTPAGTNTVFAPAGPVSSGAYVASGAWQDMTVEVRVRVTAFGQPSSSNRAEIYARYRDPGHFYAVSLRGDGKLGLRRNASGFGPVASVAVAENEWHTLKLKVSGPENLVAVEGYLDGVLLTTATDSSDSLDGTVGTAGLGVYGGTLADFDDLLVSSP